MATLLVTAIHAWLLRREKPAFRFAALGALLYLLSFVTWLLWVAPPNSVLATWPPGPMAGNFEAVCASGASGTMLHATIKFRGSQSRASECQSVRTPTLTLSLIKKKTDRQ